ncbi:MAG: PIG-L family deacetylase [Phycisphaerae bacterium]|nr:PIG-L family deacetylase [Phycisphaerae bacterium]
MPENTQQLDIVFTSPHPDDLEIFLGGAIAKAVKLGYRVAMVHSTTGEPTPNGTLEQRRAEAAKAAEILGVETMEILSLPNRELMDCPENRYVLATALRRYRPKMVVTLAGRTPMASPDHWQSELLAESSVFYAKLTKWDDRFDGTSPHSIGKLVYRQIPRSLETVEWPTTFVVDITDTIEQKLAAVACYESQFNPDRIDGVHHWLRTTAGAEGSLARVEYGETYCLPRPLGTSDLVKFLA